MARNTTHIEPIAQEGTDSLFKEGYTFELKTFNFESPSMKKAITKAHKEQEEVRERKLVDVESLNRVCVV
ncbi:MAG: hypothetical protein JWO92_676 [Chitinophagaceae bacterium]|nr:hypothetical protein [Chitinophagaceae bacterium]MDB5222391.1 hypothetical protein [Chitinophagaceae bacterium]